MNTPRSLHPPRPAGLPASLLFSALAGAVLLLLMGVELWRGTEQYRQLQQLSAAQQHTIPQALQAQRLVRNLETVRLEGERMLAQPDEGQRTQSMYVVDVIVAHPGTQEDPRVAQALQQAQKQLQGLPHHALPTETERRQWTEQSLALARLADAITAESIERVNSAVDQTRRSIDRGLWQLGVSVLVLTVSLLAFVLVLYTALIRPLGHVSAVLSDIQRGRQRARPVPAGARLTRELGRIHQAMGQLDTLMRENESIRADLQTSANTDSLTGLHNRRHFMEAAQLAVARAHRSRSPTTVAIADIDHFKHVNDHFGHAAGDQVLQAVARRLQMTLRQTDICCRYGGEEFAFVFPDTPLQDAGLLANRLREVVAATPIALPSGQPLSISLSLGLAEVGGQALDAALNQADQAMYRAKMAGRNRMECAQQPTATTA